MKSKFKSKKKIDDLKKFDLVNKKTIKKMSGNKNFQKTSKSWFLQASKYDYSYHFRWLGLPIIQYPQDILALQEIIWDTKPDCIIETGVARGGSLIFYASILKLLNSKGFALGIDIDIRSHNRKEIEKHPLKNKIKMIQGSSSDPSVYERVKKLISKYKKVMVVLDSNHTHQHVLEELNLYSQLVSKGCYLVVLDTIINDLPENTFPDRPWNRKNNPKTAVKAFMKQNKKFKFDNKIEDKLMITVAPGGYLKCVR